MSRKTDYLKLHLPDENEYYRVEEDQNQNFEKIDAKLKEWDTDKEPSFSKNTAFNKSFGTTNGTVLEGSKLAEINTKIDDKVSKSGDVMEGSLTISNQNPLIFFRDLRTGDTSYDGGYIGFGSNEKILQIVNRYSDGATYITAPNLETTSKEVVEAVNELHANKADFEKIVGKEYGGILNRGGTKTKDKTYYDTNTKKLYECIRTNTYQSPNIDCYTPIDLSSLSRDVIIGETLYEVDYDSTVDTSASKNINLKKSISNYREVDFFVMDRNDAYREYSIKKILVKDLLRNKNLIFQGKNRMFVKISENNKNITIQTNDANRIVRVVGHY